jgi:hypothetical protein
MGAGQAPADDGTECGTRLVDEQGAEARLAEIAIFAGCSNTLSQVLLRSSLAATEQGGILGPVTAPARGTDRGFPQTARSLKLVKTSAS